MAGRILALGDIHGCNQALVLLLSLVQLTAIDTLVVLGDAIDRGPESRQVIDQLLSVKQTCKLIFLMGNHEQMLRDVLMGQGLFGAWQDVGGRETLHSYGGGGDRKHPTIPSSLPSVRRAILGDGTRDLRSCIAGTGGHLRWTEETGQPDKV